ncbi:uncharacterized protein LOC115685640 [Syzygium oleosum]|uniref:uncharacterized protein LOC115685640 n=1 Tax=Syzygium oleosum TaxID=219896 RepID=UPI0024BA62A8|nr:uncharacterized protein LOC115685640 [Syzygium oleosum]
MEDPKTTVGGDDPLFPPNFVTIHQLREQWLHRRRPPPPPQQQPRQKQLEARRRSPPGEPPQPPFPGPARKDPRKQPEQELPRRETDFERESVRAGPRKESDSRPSPADCYAVRRNASVEEGSDGRRAIGSSGPKPSEKSSRGECAGSGADEKAESALVKDQRKPPERELPRGEPDIDRESVKASPRNGCDSRPCPAIYWAVRRNGSVKEGSGGRRAVDSSGPKPSEKSSRGERAGFGADEKAESALVKDQRKQPEQELPRGEPNTERERVKKEADSRPSPANRRGVRRNTSVKEGSGGRQAIDSSGPKPSEKSSSSEYAGSGADEKAESALVKDQRKQPEQELPRGEPNTERERVKKEADSRPSPANRRGVRRNTSVKEGSGGRQAIDSSGPKPSEKSSSSEYAGSGADEKAESALVKDQGKRPGKELRRGENNTEGERVKASPRNESDSRPSTAVCWAVRHNTSFREGSDGRRAIGLSGPKPSEKSSRGEYASFGADEKAESTLVAVVSVVAQSAEQVKKTEEWEKKKKKKKKNKNKSGRERDRRLNKGIVRAKEKGVKPEEGEANEPAEEIKKEKFQCASSEDQNVMLESREVRVEAKPEEGVVHTPAEEAKKLFQHAGSESENAMPESEEVQVEVENAAANASHGRAKVEGLNKQVWVINSKVGNERELRNLSLQYDSKKGGFQSGRSNRRDHKGYGEGIWQQRRVREQSSNVVWVRKEDMSDGHAGESSS